MKIEPKRKVSSTGTIETLSTNYTIHFEMNWDLPEREADAGCSLEGTTIASNAMASGGEQSLTITGNETGVSYFFLYRVNLYAYEECNVSYRLFFNGELYAENIVTLVGHLTSIPYGSFTFTPPLANDFNLDTFQENNCNDTFSLFSILPIYNDLDQYWRTDRPMTFTIQSGSDYCQFASVETNELLGPTIIINYGDVYDYYLYANRANLPFSEKEIILQAEANGIVNADTLILRGWVYNRISFSLSSNEIYYGDLCELTIGAETIGSSCPPPPFSEDETFSVSIIEGSEYGYLVNTKTGETGTTLGNIHHIDGYIFVDFIADGVVPPNSGGIVKINASSSDSDLPEEDRQFIVLPSSIIVEFEKDNLFTGETSDIYLYMRGPEGEKLPFPNGAEQEFYIEIIENWDYTKLFAVDDTNGYELLTDVKQPIKIKADDDIELDSLKVWLYIETSNGSGGTIASAKKGKKSTENSSRKRSKQEFILTKQSFETNRENGKNKSNDTIQKNNAAPNTNTTQTEEENILWAVASIDVLNKTEIEILEPTGSEPINYKISATPEMPTIIVKARLKNYSGGSVTFNYSFILKWKNWQGEDSNKHWRYFEDIFEGTVAGQNSDIVEWTIPWGEKFRGGDVTELVVTATTGNGTYSEEIENPYKIFGDNPSKEEVKEGLTIQEQVVIYKESVPKWGHFKNEIFPSFGGPYGYGLMQLDKIDAEGGGTRRATDQEVWNWRQNRVSGKAHLARKYTRAVGYGERLRLLGAKGGKDAYLASATDLTTEEQLWKEAFQNYNGGNHWQWVVIDIIKGSGRWIVRPGTNGYGKEAWVTYSAVNNENPPDGW